MKKLSLMGKSWIEPQKERTLTYTECCEIFLVKYPNGKLFKHNEMAQCDVGIKFEENSRVYNYNGSYYEVMIKLGLEKEYNKMINKC